MNRQLLVICILLSMLALRAEPIHVALLGSPAQLVDLLQAELSELKELALLERREIDKIMQERKLAELSWENLSKEFPHTDVLVVLSENNKGKVGRVLAFNAKNGARLMDMNCGGEADDGRRSLSGLGGDAVRQCHGFFEGKMQCMAAIVRTEFVTAGNDTAFGKGEIGYRVV